MPSLFLFLLSFVPRFVLIFFSLPIEGTADELGALSYPATLAGFDWSDALSGWSNYYGGGFTVLFTPLFMIFSDSPVLLYRAILLFCVIAQVISAFVCYRILTRYLHVADTYFAVFAAAALSYLLLLPAVVYVNEHAIIMVIWLIALVLLALAENDISEYKRIFLSILLLLLLSWSILIHTRCIVLWFAVAIAVLIYRWVLGKWLISPIFALPAIGAYLLCRFISSEAIRILWGAGSNGVANNSLPLTSDFSLLFSETGLKALTYIVAGHIITYAELTAGIVLFAFTLSFAILFLAIFRKRSYFSDASGEIAEVKSRSLVVATVFLASVVATTLSFLLSSWSTSLANLMLDNHIDNVPVISLNYIRYAYSYCGPLAAVFLAFVYHKLRLVRFSVLLTVPVFAAAAVIWQMLIIPFVETNFNSSFITQTNLPFGMYAFTGYEYNEPTILYLLVFVAASLFLVTAILSFARLKRVLSIFLLALLLYQYVYMSYFFYYPMDLKLTRQISPFLSVMDTARDMDTLPDKINVQSSNPNFILAQFYHPDVAFARIPDNQTIPEYVDSSPVDNVLVYRYQIENFPQEEIAQMSALGYQHVILGPHYVLFTRDESVWEAVLSTDLPVS